MADKDNSMKMHVSALVDGELDVGDVASTVHALRGCGELRAEWCAYYRIGAALRGEREISTDVVARVMASLELEPTVLAPKAQVLPGRLDGLRSVARPMLALAASGAGVAVVAWLTLTSEGAANGNGGINTVNLAGGRPALVLTTAKPATPSRLQDYVLAHQVYAPGAAIVGGAVGGARNIHTVSASSEHR